MSGEKEPVYYDDQWKQLIPPGFRFAPTDAELIQHYLSRKVNGQFILLGIIHEANVYDGDPCHLPGMDMEEEFTYFFTNRERKYRNGSKIDRVTRDGKGYWKMTSKITNVYADGNDIKSYLGKKNTLVYYVKTPKEQKDIKTNWIMHEFELGKKEVDSPATSSCQSQEKPFNNYVVCRVYRRQVKGNGETDEPKDFTGPRPVMTDDNNGEAPVVPSAKRKFEPNKDTLITCDHTHDIAMTTNSNYFYVSHELQAATICGNMMATYDFGETSKAITSSSPHDIMVKGEGVLGVGGINDQAWATVYQNYKSQQNPHVAERQTSGLVGQEETKENDALEGLRNMTIRRDDEPNNATLCLENDLAALTSGDLWDCSSTPCETFSALTSGDLWDFPSTTCETFSFYGENLGI